MKSRSAHRQLHFIIYLSLITTIVIVLVYKTFDSCLQFAELHGAAISALSALAVAIFTLFLVIATFQLKAIANEQHKTSHTIERAYVKMSHTPPGICIANLSNGIVDITIEIANKGHTPAEITGIRLFNRALPNGAQLPALPPYDETQTRQTVRAFLMPSDNFLYTCQMSLDDGRDTYNSVVLNATKSLYVFGYVDYIDKFGVRHRHGYARMLDPKAKVGVREGNNLMHVTQPGYNYDRARDCHEGSDWDT